jgi:hypothetical protein
MDSKLLIYFRSDAEKKTFIRRLETGEPLNSIIHYLNENIAEVIVDVPTSENPAKIRTDKTGL